MITIIRQDNPDGSPHHFYLKVDGRRIPRSEVAASSNWKKDAAEIMYIINRLRQGYSERMAVIRPGQENH